MPIVAMPDGQQVNFPDDMPSEQIKGLIASKFPQLAQKEKQTGWSAITKPISQFIDAERERGTKLNDIVTTTQQDKQSIPEGLVQGALNEVGALAQVPVTAGNIAGKVLYQGAPNIVQKGIDNIEKVVAPVAQQYQQNQQIYNTQNPRAGRNFQAARELTNLLPLANSEVRSVIGEGLNAAGNAAKNVAIDSALVAPHGIITAARGFAAKSPEVRQTIEDALKAASINDYSALDAANVITNSSGSKKISDNINQYLKDNKVSLNPTTHPNTYNIVKELDEIINSDIKNIKAIPEGDVNTLSGLQNIGKKGELSISALDQQRKALGGASYTNPEDVRAAAIVRSAMDNAINPITSKIMPRDLNNGTPENMGLLQQAQAKWARKSRYENINDILNKAAGDPNKIKAGLTNFLNKDKNTLGWSDKELNALKNAAQTGTVEKLFKMGGKFGLDLGTSLTPGNTIGPIVGAVASGGLTSGSGVIAGGTLLRQLQKYMARGKAEQLLSVIQNGKIPKEIMNFKPTDARQILNSIKEGNLN